MDAVLGIFDREKAPSVDFAVRLEAAEALGQAGDPRIGKENWVLIEGFEIGKYPVTVVEYRRFVEDEGYREKRWWKEGGVGERAEPGEWEWQKDHPNRPVTSVSWYEASAYAAWAGARLPSEAEWERAARGTEGREYPWGCEKPDANRANYRPRGPSNATPVGLYPAGGTPEGIMDMAGNVWEWVENSEDQGKLRVLRGGSWENDAAGLRAEVRGRGDPGSWSDHFGFRIARSV